MTRGARRGSRDRTPIRALPIAIVLAAAWGIATLNLGTVFSPGLWMAGAFAVAVPTLLVAGLVGTALPHRRWVAVTPGLAAGAFVALLMLSASGRTAVWLRDAASALHSVRIRVFGGVAPLAVDGPLTDVLVAAVSGACVVSLILALPLRSPVFAGLVPALVLLVPAAVTGVSAGLGAFVAAGATLALLTWLRAPRLTWGGPIAAATAVAVAAGAFALAPPARDRVWNSALVLSPVSSTVPDVTVALADDLRQHSQTAAFSFTSTRGGPIRFSLATLADFEGGRWQPRTDALDPARTIDEALAADTAIPRPTDEVDRAGDVLVTMEGLVSEWLPVPQAQTQQIAGVGGGFDAGDWEWMADSATARSDDAVTQPEMTYSAQFVPMNSEQRRVLSLFTEAGAGNPRPELDALSDGRRVYPEPEDAPKEIRRYLELPGDVPGALQGAAEEVARGFRDRFSIAYLLQSWFRGGGFAYDESAPYEAGTDPDDPYAVMESFLDERAGFCVHFASTFAVMARSLGVPTRVAVGYAATAAPERSVTVRGDDLHAWPEVYFDDVGWIAFEPTPGVGTDRGGQDDGQRPDEAGAQPPGAEDESSERAEIPDDDESTDGAALPDDNAREGSGAEGSRPAATAAWAGIGWTVLAIAVLLLPAGVRRWRGWRRVSASEAGTDAVGTWREFRDTALDLGFLGRGSPPRARTADALVESLADRGVLSGDALDAARALVSSVNAERFGSGASHDLITDIAERRLLREAKVGLHGAAGRLARVAAALAPRSVFPMRTSD